MTNEEWTEKSGKESIIEMVKAADEWEMVVPEIVERVVRETEGTVVHNDLITDKGKIIDKENLKVDIEEIVTSIDISYKGLTHWKVQYFFANYCSEVVVAVCTCQKFLKTVTIRVVIFVIQVLDFFILYYTIKVFSFV